MASHRQKATQSGNSECRNLWPVNSFEGTKKGGGQLQTKNIMRVITCKMVLSSLYILLNT